MPEAEKRKMKAAGFATRAPFGNYRRREQIRRFEVLPRQHSLEWDDISSNRHPALAVSFGMSFSQNRPPLLRDML
jgi:hypothetical protein